VRGADGMESCACEAKPTLLFACSGGSNVGQLANDACRALAGEGQGKFFCLAGIGGQVRGLVESAKSATKVVAVDGCGVKCALKALQAAEVPVSNHIVLTDWGIEKNANLFPAPELVAAMKDKVLIAMAK